MSDSRLSSVVAENLAAAYYSYDSLNRISAKTVENAWLNIMVSYNYSYLAGANGSSTTLVDSLCTNGAYTYYSYDAVGNVTGVYTDSERTQGDTYVYDNLGQLTRVNDLSQNKTFVYAYDTNGNITSVSEYAYTTGDLTAVTPTKVTSYTYGDASWGDLLTSYDGQSITYDAIGNPLSYLGATLTWTNGRRLASYTKGDTAVTYTYNANGMRTSKTVNGVTTDYVYDGNTLISMKKGTDSALYFFYDAEGVNGFYYDDFYYFFEKNLQGDIVKILNESGSTVVTYDYDEWGRLLSVSGSLADYVGYLNPFLYRGYVYDHETALYYLQSRYYNPEVKRFVNGDGLINQTNIRGYNLFSYCGNDPVNLIDPSGKCFYLKGKWSHDKWEYLGGYEIKPDPAKEEYLNNYQYKLISQYKKSENYNKKDWEYVINGVTAVADSSDGCSSASIAMALSTLGSNKTPGDIYVENGYTNYTNWNKHGYKCVSISSKESDYERLNQMIRLYRENPEKYAPPIVDVKASGMHFVVVIDFDGKNYTILDPGQKSVYITDYNIEDVGVIKQYHN